MVDDKEITITEDIKDLVMARIDLMPPDLAVSIGSSGTFTKNELIEHIKQGDEVGKTIIKAEMEFLEALKSGTLLREINSLENDENDN